MLLFTDIDNFKNDTDQNFDYHININTNNNINQSKQIWYLPFISEIPVNATIVFLATPLLPSHLFATQMGLTEFPPSTPHPISHSDQARVSIHTF